MDIKNITKILDLNKLTNLFSSKSLLGVDIGTYSVKIVEMKGSGRKYTLVRAAVLPLPQEVQTSEISVMEKKRIIVDVIKNYLSQNRVNVKNAATSVSGSSVIVRYVKFPKITREELSKSIVFEAEPYIPFDIREVNLGFYIMGDVTEEGQKKTETVLVAAKKDIIQDKMDTLTQAGLRPVLIDIDAFAMESSYDLNHDSPSGETVIIVNIGASVTNMSIIENGISKVVRDIFLGGNSFTKALQKNMGCNFQTAEEMKRKYGLLIDPAEKEKALSDKNHEALQVSNTMNEVCHDLLNEIHRSIDFFYSQRGEQQILNRIYISGGGACLKNIEKYFTQELKLPAEIYNPLKSVENSEKVEAENLPVLSVAAGLATRQSGDTAK
jgi:type IV pilus assembly protein PilM